MLFKSKITLIATAIIVLSFVISSDAFEIESLWSDYGPVAYDYGNDDIAFTLKTDVAYSHIDWYIDFHDGEDYQFQETVFGDGENTYSDFYPDSLPGKLTGKKYTIKANAFFHDADLNSFWDSDTYDIYVFQPKTETQTDRERSELTPLYPGVWGVVTLYRQFYDGNIIAIEAGSQGGNSGDEDVSMYCIFRHTIKNKQLHPKEVKTDVVTIGSGEWYTPPDSGLLDFNCSHIDKNETWDSEAYVKLIVNGGSGESTYEIINTIEFTEEHNFNRSD